MNALYDLARVGTATIGTGTITLGAAVLGYLTFSQAGVPDGAIVSYGIADGANSETGWGVYTESGLTLTRNVYRSTGAGNNTPINLSGSAQIFITALAEDFRFPSSDADSQGSLPRSSSTGAGWAITSNYDGDGGVDIWNTVDGATRINFRGKTGPSTQVFFSDIVWLPAANYGQITIGLADFSYLGIDGTVGFIGTNGTDFDIYVADVRKARFPQTGGLEFLGATSGGITLKTPAIAGTNTLTLPAGTTDFSATGGTSQVVKQDSLGGPFTVGQLGSADINNDPDQGFAVPAWSVDLDFTTGIYWNAPYNPPNSLTVSRASVGYIDNLAGVWSEVAANVLRRSNKGALIEASRTNSIRNNSMQGAVAGSPGTLPTNWLQNLDASLTRTIVGTGTSNGIDYIEIRINGTTTSATPWTLFFENNNVIVAATGENWTNSIFVALVGGSLTNISATQLGWNENTSAGGFVAQKSAAIGPPTSTITRYSHSAANTGGATVARVNPFFRLSSSAGVAIDLTVRIGWPQMELGRFISSPIRTTSAAGTRAADVVDLTLPPAFGSAISMAGSGTPLASIDSTGDQHLVQLDDGTANNRLILRRKLTTGTINAFGRSANVTVLDQDGAVWAQLASGTAALAAAADNHAAAFNGSQFMTDLSGAMPVAMTTVRIGGNHTASNQFNGYINRILIWPESRLNNSNVVDVSQALPQSAGWVVAGDRGTTTNDNAPPGDVGEVISSLVLIGSAVALTTDVPANVTSLALTAGDWDVFGEVWFNPAGTTNIAHIIAAINTVSATLPTAPDPGAARSAMTGGNQSGVALIQSVGPTRQLLSGPTTVYLIAQSTFTVSTNAAYGRIGARRAR